MEPPNYVLQKIRTPSTPVNTGEKKIRIVVVESHQHALEHIHEVLRKEGLLGTSWAMHHIDAHPDLACPPIYAGCCFRPSKVWDGKNLYEHLDLRASGISEWIMPLVLAADLNAVDWIVPRDIPKPQIPFGDHTMTVGVFSETSSGSPMKIDSFLDLPEDSTVRTDCKIPYYLDELSYASKDGMWLTQRLDLRVTSKMERRLGKDSPWLLDICFDYFAYQNPFLTDIYAEFGNELDDYLSWALNNLNNVYLMSSDQDAYQRTRDAVIRDMSNSLCRIIESDTNCSNQGSPEYPVYQALAKRSPESHELWVKSIKDALPHLSMPHSHNTLQDEREILLDVERVCDGALSCLNKDDSGPFLVTMARSTEDGFTPGYLVSRIQNRVLEELHSRFCNCGKAPLFPEENRSDCRIELTFDYGKWEGSTLFQR